MNPEMFVYTLVVALIGMTTVFVGLTLLSLMMLLLRRIFGSEVGARPTPTPIKGSVVQNGSDHRWVIAAAAVFLEEETAEGNRSAAGWTPEPIGAGGEWYTRSRV
ncbi:MAG TPA: OadG family transporter subunit [Spirochaetia bacterium]|nr:OadG family transporter subunit [Spirochaetia bacterium]